MSKLNVVFEVQDEAGNVVVARSQTPMELDAKDLSGPELTEAMKLTLDRVFRAGTTDGVERAEELAALRVREACESVGIVIARFIDLKLRRWTKDQQEFQESQG